MGGEGDLHLPVLLSQVSVCCAEAETTALSRGAPQPHTALSKAFQVRRPWSHTPETTPQVATPTGVCKEGPAQHPQETCSPLATPSQA